MQNEGKDVNSEVVCLPAWLEIHLQTDAETPQEVPKLNKNPYKITLSRVVHLNLV